MSSNDDKLTGMPEFSDMPEKPKTPESPKGAGTYQMLWDCRFCGSQKLLGITHRHCPNCGAAQDPAWRYFPAEGDMVALEDHEYVGADKICPACQQPNSAASTYCSECGADLATGEAAPLQGTRAIGQGVAETHTRRDVVKDEFDAEMARVGVTSQGGGKFMGLPGRTWAIIGVVIALLACVGLIYVLTYSKDVSGTVERMGWERTVSIDVFQQVTDEGWRDQMPSGAYDTSCSERKRRDEQVQVGSHQECRDVDQGDGSFRRVCEDVPDYDTRPVYDTYCDYKIDLWVPMRVVEASSENAAVAPYWPEFSLAAGVGQYGREREGDKDETYTVVIKTSDGKTESCHFEEPADWSRFSEGDEVTYEADISGNPDCSTLEVAE